MWLNFLLVDSQRSEQPKNVNFEPIIRVLKMIFLTGTKCKIRFIYVRFNCASPAALKLSMSTNNTSDHCPF